jgi:RNA polymerase sigma-70 factor (ECF subfamily)
MVRAELVQRYSGAVYRYLLGAVRNPDVADELCQDFAVKFLEGQFHCADPQRGRFRDYVKTVLINLVRQYQAACGKQPRPLPEQLAQDGKVSLGEDSERDFLRAWREQMLERTWDALRSARATYHTVLRLRVDEPDLTSREIAERISNERSLPMTSASVRKTLQRAHTKFADLLIDEIAHSLDDPDLQQLQLELEELDLLRYCRSALQRWESNR